MYNDITNKSDIVAIHCFILLISKTLIQPYMYTYTSENILFNE